MDVASTLTQMANETEKIQSKNRVTGTTDLGQDAFLQLLMTQLKYQDPLSPMSNEEFMSQQAQFTQVSELQKLNQAVSNQNDIMQASSLIGKTVKIADPNNPQETIEGRVTEAKFNGKDTSIVINDNDYSMDSIISIKDSQGEV